jgi:hypothetical protein
VFAWGERERLIPVTLFEVNTETVITLDPEYTARAQVQDRRGRVEVAERCERTSAGIIVAMLDTCCRRASCSRRSGRTSI